MRIVVPTLLSYAALLAASPSFAGDRLVVRDRAYGPSQRITGVYFSNWENSTLTACSAKSAPCNPPATAEPEWLECAPGACAELERRIKALGGDPRAGVRMVVTFEGRRAVQRRPKAYLHDTESRLYAERILSVAPLRR